MITARHFLWPACISPSIKKRCNRKYETLDERVIYLTIRECGWHKNVLEIACLLDSPFYLHDRREGQTLVDSRADRG